MSRDPSTPEEDRERASADPTEDGDKSPQDGLKDQELSDQVARVVALLQKLETLHSEQQRAPAAPSDGLAQLSHRPAKERAPAPISPPRLEPSLARAAPPKWIPDAGADDDVPSEGRRLLIPVGIGFVLLVAIAGAMYLMPSPKRAGGNTAVATSTDARTPAVERNGDAAALAAEAAERRQAEERKQLEAAEAERRRAAEVEANRRRAEEERRLAQQAEAQRQAEETRRQAEEAQARQAAEQQRLATEAEAKRKTEEEERLAEEAEAKKKAEEEKRLAAEAEAKKKAEEERRLAEEAEAKKKAEEEKRLAAEAEAKKKAEEEKRLAAEAEAKKKAEEAKRVAAEAEAKKKAEEEKRLAAEAEAKKKAEEQRRLAEEAEAKRKAEEAKQAAAEAEAKRQLAEQQKAGRTRTAAALTGTGAPSAVRAGAPCSETPTLAAEAVPGGRVQVAIVSPCRADEKATIQYGPFSFARTLDNNGRLNFTLDLFQGTRPGALVVFADGSQHPISLHSPDLAQVSKVAVVWKGPINLDLHAFEYLARPGGRGHVWSGAPSSAENAEAEARGGKQGRGFMSSTADGTANGDKVEVYTFWNVPGQEPGVISTVVDYETRGDTPSGDACGSGSLARVDFRLLTLVNGRPAADEHRVLAPAACGQPLSREVRFSPDTGQSLAVRK